MNEREFQDKLAEYLAGELSATEAEAFRAALASDERRRRLVDELQAAAAALEARDVSEEHAREATAELRFADIAARAAESRTLTLHPHWMRFANVALRYAAVIVLAFVAGFWARGGAWNSVPPQSPAQPTVAETDSIESVDVGATVEVNDRYVKKFAKASRAFPNASSFSRSLMVLASNSK